MALVCRPTNVCLLPVAAYGLAQAAATAGWRRTLACVPLAATALVPVGCQVLAWHALSGHWLYYSYGDEGFDWRHPALWQTLFSSRHGLFFWSPVLLLAVAALLVRARHAFVYCWGLGLGLLWYANSAWHCWWFGDAYGARAFLELAGLFGVGIGLAFEGLRRLPRLAAGLAVLAVVFNVVLLALYVSHRLPRDGYLLRGTAPAAEDVPGCRRLPGFVSFGAPRTTPE
jgi:hypothetical protein